jgi:hypothetical protein
MDGIMEHKIQLQEKWEKRSTVGLLYHFMPDLDDMESSVVFSILMERFRQLTGDIEAARRVLGNHNYG